MKKKDITELIERYMRVSFLIHKTGESLVKGEICEDLTNDQYYMLRYIEQRESCTSTALAEAFNVNKSAITAIITRLDEKKLIKRSRDEGDRRVVYIALTEEGSRLFKKTEKKIHDLVEKMISGFEEEEIRAFIRTYEKLSDIMADMKKQTQEASV